MFEMSTCFFILISFFAIPYVNQLLVAVVCKILYIKYVKTLASTGLGLVNSVSYLILTRA